ncbi:Diisopropyl-fluorophosphatase [Trichoplax sp. H2]|nr:Diisopropyl-fluorophosphatase [Trichoplax sp. H2]|eukprot:RDD38014.1 Diisopropyl-fluorophosphatase [Trichoplax sp. H2]
MSAEKLKVEFTKVAEGLLGAEGPVFNKNGQLMMVAPEVEEEDGRSAGQILKINLQNGQSTVWCRPKFHGVGGIPAGCQCDQENNIWVADMRHGILKVSPDGHATQIVEECEGQVMQGCNDCAFDSRGNLYVSAPAGPIAPQPYQRSIKEPFGSLYCRQRNGDVVKLDTGFRFSNGLAVTADDKTLIVAETVPRKLWAYDIIGDGQITNKRLWATLPNDSEDNGPDGMDFDCQGNLLVANWDGSHVDVFDHSGKHTYRIECPFNKPSNVHFQPNSNRVYVTEHQYHGLWYFDWKFQGQKQYCEL